MQILIKTHMYVGPGPANSSPSHDCEKTRATCRSGTLVRRCPPYRRQQLGSTCRRPQPTVGRQHSQQAWEIAWLRRNVISQTHMHTCSFCSTIETKKHSHSEVTSLSEKWNRHDTEKCHQSNPHAHMQFLFDNRNEKTLSFRGHILVRKLEPSWSSEKNCTFCSTL